MTRLHQFTTHRLLSPHRPMPLSHTLRPYFSYSYRASDPASTPIALLMKKGVEVRVRGCGGDLGTTVSCSLHPEPLNQVSLRKGSNTCSLKSRLFC